MSDVLLAVLLGRVSSAVRGVHGSSDFSLFEELERSSKLKEQFKNGKEVRMVSHLVIRYQLKRLWEMSGCISRISIHFLTKGSGVVALEVSSVLFPRRYMQVSLP